MRQDRLKQLPLSPQWPDHRHAEELREMSKILDENPTLAELVLQDVCRGRSDAGASGMSGEQILRCAIVKQMHQFSYRSLSFHLADSLAFRNFCRLPMDWNPSRSTLQENISQVTAATWKAINSALLGWAEREGYEDGTRVRIDSTAVEADIAHPLDHRLLLDSVRVLNRLCRDLAEATGRRFAFHNHVRRAKRRAMEITNAKRQNLRLKPYADLLKVTRRTVHYSRAAMEATQDCSMKDQLRLRDKLSRHVRLAQKVIDQTHRRVFEGESVAASEKIVSIFQPRTDILRKGGRDTVYGHKVFLTCGGTSLILDCRAVRGNPADVSQMDAQLENHRSQYGRYPLQAAFDGGFASRENLQSAKHKGVRDVAFARKCGLKVSEMVSRVSVYSLLRRFRAGIEGCISLFKRCFGVRRCLWKGWPHFRRYLGLATVSYNLLVLARLRL